MLRPLVLILFLLFLTGCLQSEGPAQKRSSELSSSESVPQIETTTDSETTETIDQYAHLDPKKEIPPKLLRKAIAFYEKKNKEIKNQNYLAIIDFSQHSSKERFFILDLITGEVDRYLVAHGRNSDPDHDGIPTKFSNIEGSLMSSQGFYLTAETYEGKYGLSLRLDGLSVTNSLARKRAIVIHGADYIFPGEKIGRSYGCPAIEHRFVKEVIERIKGGTLLFAE